MEKKVLAAASYAQQKYYLEKEFEALPEQIREEIQVVCVTLAEKLACTFLMGFYEDGEVYFETVKNEDDFNFDEIGAELEVKELMRTKKELLAALQMWYQVFCTEDGAQLKESLLREES